MCQGSEISGCNLCVKTQSILRPSEIFLQSAHIRLSMQSFYIQQCRQLSSCSSRTSPLGGTAHPSNLSIHAHLILNILWKLCRLDWSGMQKNELPLGLKHDLHVCSLSAVQNVLHHFWRSGKVKLKNGFDLDPTYMALRLNHWPLTLWIAPVTLCYYGEGFYLESLPETTPLKHCDREPASTKASFLHLSRYLITEDNQIENR